MKKAFLSLALLLSALVANATVRLPKIFSDNMVIQRNAEIRIWGWADPKENVFIALNGKKVKTIASESGEWEISLPAMKAGGPYTLLVNDIKINNILIGDVYLCSGQSNMELPMRRTADLYKKDMDSIVNTNVRYVKIPLTFNFKEPQNDFKACDWKELNPKNAPEMSALCYYLGMNINISENIPVGIVNSSVGGSPIEAWMHYDALENYPA
ncbi:MAG: sialate O-acetylesterase, partial [Bacteroidaceae bacterium]|nr:sialate O-acetylesterase [Bacteroidaceae bacterium]